MQLIIFILQHTDTGYQTTDYMIAFMHFLILFIIIRLADILTLIAMPKKS